MKIYLENKYISTIVILFFTISILILLHACGSSNNQSSELKTRYKLMSLNISIDTLMIDIDSTMSGYNISSYTNNNGELLLCGYNKIKHHLDFINITKGKVLGTVKLEREGPVGIGTIDV